MTSLVITDTNTRQESNRRSASFAMGNSVSSSCHRLEKGLMMHFHSLSLNGQHATLTELLSKSKKGDKISCMITDPRCMGMFYELESRGADIFPPLLSQSLSLSKVHQALHFMDYMIPSTQVLFRTSNIHKLLRRYGERSIVKTVVKEDRGSMGMGGHPCWSLNELAWAIVHVTPFPVVVQPMLDDFREFRLVVMGETVVAKEKIGSDGLFWNNRIFGGVTKLIDPTKEMVEFGKEVMRIGKFPWAYIDLFVTDADTFVSEINLSGSNAGMKDYKLNTLKREMIERWLADG